MNKDLIHSRFAKHLKDYEENAKIQKLMAEKLITLCSRNKYKNILEIGCGTGLLTGEAVERLEFETYTAIDIVGECEPFIKKINDRVAFFKADFEEFEITAKPDLIISNAVLQWAGDLKTVVNRFKSALDKDGEFVFSTFGRENFREIFYIEGTSLDYYSESELREILPEFTVYPQEIHIMSFGTASDVLKHFQLTGVNGIENKHWTKADLKRFEKAYSNLCVKRPTLTYNPIYLKYSTHG